MVETIALAGASGSQEKKGLDRIWADAQRPLKLLRYECTLCLQPYSNGEVTVHML